MQKYSVCFTGARHIFSLNDAFRTIHGEVLTPQTHDYIYLFTLTLFYVYVYVQSSVVFFLYVNVNIC